METWRERSGHTAVYGSNVLFPFRGKLREFQMVADIVEEEALSGLGVLQVAFLECTQIIF